MDQTEIFTRHKEIEKSIILFLTPNEFVLNTIMADLYAEQAKLREECGQIGHKYDANGLCVFCRAQDPNHQWDSEEE